MSANDQDKKLPESSNAAKVSRTALQLAGATPYIGSIFSLMASAWSEREQERANKFFEQWIKMLSDELKEKEITIIEILARLDLQDEKIKERIESKEYQSIIRKTFREWAGAESETKRIYIRNILANAAASSITSDDVIRLFIDWIATYSELHFKVIGAIYNNKGITRGGVWTSLDRKPTKENSADADLYKLLFRDLSTGGIIRQIRETDYYGNFVKKTKAHRSNSGPTMTSAFDNEEGYELTELGQQYVHYAMTDLPPKIEFKSHAPHGTSQTME